MLEDSHAFSGFSSNDGAATGAFHADTLGLDETEENGLPSLRFAGGGRGINEAKRCTVDSWAKGISAITLFVEDIAAAKAFYREVFGLPVVFEDDVSAVFKFGGTLINLLATTAAVALIEPAAVGGPDSASRLQLTIEVDDVDATCAELARRGVELLNGPMDRPWGIRTACFRDPGGHIWEIAK